MSELVTVTDVKAELGEGPIWHLDTLYWIDILGKTVYSYQPKDDTLSEYPIDQYIGTIVPRQSGGLVMALQEGFYFLDTDSGKLTSIADPEEHIPDNRFNDGKCDPAGRFWAGTMAQDHHADAGHLYMMDNDLVVMKKFGPVSISNGLCWSLDNTTMYYIDSPTRKVLAFDYNNETGDISNPAECIRFSEKDGYPDGMTIDCKGNLWIARWDGWSVGCYNPTTGELIEKIDVPAQQVSACAFGGENLDTLYITTAQEDFTEQQRQEQPLAGRLFQIKPGVRGVPSFAFAG